MGRSKTDVEKSGPLIPERKPKFKMSNVPESQKIKRKDSKLIGKKITNCYQGNRYKLIIKKIFTDDKKQLCIECYDDNYKVRTFFAKDCKLIEKTGIRKKKSNSSIKKNSRIKSKKSSA